MRQERATGACFKIPPSSKKKQWLISANVSTEYDCVPESAIVQDGAIILVFCFSFTSQVYFLTLCRRRNNTIMGSVASCNLVLSTARLKQEAVEAGVGRRVGAPVPQVWCKESPKPFNGHTVIQTDNHRGRLLHLWSALGPNFSCLSYSYSFALPQ